VASSRPRRMPSSRAAATPTVWHFGPDVHPAGRPGAGAALARPPKIAGTHGLKNLSMGIERRLRDRDPVRRHHIRVGSAIFGHR